MNWSRLALVTPPAVPPLSLEAAKAHLKVEGGDQDPDIQAKLDDAIAQFDGPRGVGLALITQTWRLSLDHWGMVQDRRHRGGGDHQFSALFHADRGHGQRQGIVIPLRPVQSITSITYRDFAGIERTLDPALYDVDLDHQPPLEIVPAFGVCWPGHKIGRGVIKVTFVAGFGDTADKVPADLIGAIQLTQAHRYRNREGVVGVQARDSSTELPRGVAEVIARYIPGHIA